MSVRFLLSSANSSIHGTESEFIDSSGLALCSDFCFHSKRCMPDALPPGTLKYLAGVLLFFHDFSLDEYGMPHGNRRGKTVLKEEGGRRPGLANTFAVVALVNGELHDEKRGTGGSGGVAASMLHDNNDR